MGDSRQAFKDLTDMDNENGKPILLYLTSTDEKMERKVENYENSVLANEKFCITAKFFDCYQVDVTDIEEGHPILTMIKRPKPLTFFTIHKGKVLYGTKQKPSVSNLFSTCSKTLKKTHNAPLDKIVKQESKILDELDKIIVEKKKIDEKRLKAGRKLSKREDESLRKREQELFDQEAQLKEEEEKLLELEQYVIKSKKTAKT